MPISQKLEFPQLHLLSVSVVACHKPKIRSAHAFIPNEQASVFSRKRHRIAVTAQDEKLSQITKYAHYSIGFTHHADSFLNSANPMQYGRGKNNNLSESAGCDKLDYLTATIALLFSTKPICKAPAENSNKAGIGFIVSQKDPVKSQLPLAPPIVNLSSLSS